MSVGNNHKNNDIICQKQTNWMQVKGNQQIEQKEKNLNYSVFGKMYQINQYILCHQVCLFIV